MTAIQETIKGLIQHAVGSDVVVTLEHPADLQHGDYSCNVAMQQAQAEGKSPRTLAEEIVSKLPQHPDIAKAEVAGPGFINFYLSDAYLAGQVGAALDGGSDWGGCAIWANKRVMVEYTDPNPFKELHIGHVVPNSIGVALARTAAACGAEVREVTFQGDVGMHVAKSIYGMQQMGLTVESDFTAQDLGKAYAAGATAFKDDAAAKEAITALNKRIYQIYTGEETELKPLYEKGKEVSMRYFDEVYALLNSNYSHFFLESVTGQTGEELVRKHVGDVFEESDGAIVFKGEEYGLHTRVFVNAQGLPTYEAKDLGLIQLKHEWWPHDISITVTGNEISEYFKVIKKVAELILPELASGVVGVMNGMLDLKNGKMSSRTGNIIRAMDLVADVEKVMREKMPEADAQTITAVAVGAIKYSILRSVTNKDVKFDFETSISMEGDSGPYLQYTYARCKSVLGKGQYKGQGEVQVTGSGIENVLYKFPEVVERAAREYEPHYIAGFLNELASAYNSWYAQEQILDGSDAQDTKLTLTAAVAQTLKNGLYLLGIEAPEKM